MWRRALPTATVVVRAPPSGVVLKRRRDGVPREGAAHVRTRVLATLVHVAHGAAHAHASDDERSGKRARVVAAVVARGRVRARDDDDETVSRGRVVVARRVAEAGGAPTPHQSDGGGILSGSGAV